MVYEYYYVNMIILIQRDDFQSSLWGELAFGEGLFEVVSEYINII